MWDQKTNMAVKEWGNCTDFPNSWDQAKSTGKSLSLISLNDGSTRTCFLSNSMKHICGPHMFSASISILTGSNSCFSNLSLDFRFVSLNLRKTSGYSAKLPMFWDLHPHWPPAASAWRRMAFASPAEPVSQWDDGGPITDVPWLRKGSNICGKTCGKEFEIELSF